MIELRGIPSPHAEKYSSYLRPSSSSKAQHDYSREELQIEPASLIRDRLRREETQYDRQPFVSNGYFTANPVNEQYRSSDRRDKKTYIQQKTSEGTDASNERFSPAKGPVVRSHEFHTPPQDGGQFLRKADVNESRDSFVNSNDFKKQDVQRQVEIPHIEVHFFLCELEHIFIDVLSTNFNTRRSPMVLLFLSKLTLLHDAMSCTEGK